MSLLRDPREVLVAARGRALNSKRGRASLHYGDLMNILEAHDELAARLAAVESSGWGGGPIDTGRPEVVVLPPRPADSLDSNPSDL
jgi:hypothetical protein